MNSLKCAHSIIFITLRFILLFVKNMFPLTPPPPLPLPNEDIPEWFLHQIDSSVSISSIKAAVEREHLINSKIKLLQDKELEKPCCICHLPVSVLSPYLICRCSVPIHSDCAVSIGLLENLNPKRRYLLLGEQHLFTFNCPNCHSHSDTDTPDTQDHTHHTDTPKSPCRIRPRLWRRRYRDTGFLCVLGALVRQLSSTPPTPPSIFVSYCDVVTQLVTHWTELAPYHDTLPLAPPCVEVRDGAVAIPEAIPSPTHREGVVRLLTALYTAAEAPPPGPTATAILSSRIVGVLPGRLTLRHLGHALAPPHAQGGDTDPMWEGWPPLTLPVPTLHEPDLWHSLGLWDGTDTGPPSTQIEALPAPSRADLGRRERRRRTAAAHAASSAFEVAMVRTALAAAGLGDAAPPPHPGTHRGHTHCDGLG